MWSSAVMPADSRAAHAFRDSGVVHGRRRSAPGRSLALAVLPILVASSPVCGDEIAVLAAASLTDALGEIAGSFEKATGHRVSLNLGSSNDLARQIRAGAPGDVFLSADPAQMDLLERSGFVRAEARVDLLSNVLVVVVAGDSSLHLAGPGDLRAVKRLSIGDPETVPAGLYARSWLQSVGLWEELRGRTVPALNARAAVKAVETGHVEAGIVYRTDASASRNTRVAFEVPRGTGPPITYVLAPVVASHKGDLAARFVAHLRSPAAARVFEKHGFVVVEGR